MLEVLGWFLEVFDWLLQVVACNVFYVLLDVQCYFVEKKSV